MMILALDIATTMGYAYGDSHCVCPISGSVRLKRPQDAAGVAPFNLSAFLRDLLERTGIQPKLVMVEQFLPPSAQPSDKPVITQLMAHGAMESFWRSHGIEPKSAAPSTIRKEFIGMGFAPKRIDGVKPPADWIKHRVRIRCVRLGYVDATCRDLDRTDALAAWDYAATMFGGRPPRLVGLEAAQ